MKKTEAYRELLNYAEATKNVFNLRNEFSYNKLRGEQFSINLNGLIFDYSRNLVNEEIINSLVKLAEQSGLEAKRKAMFDGEKINTTEDRAVLHVALRQFRNEPLIIDGLNIRKEITAARQKMAQISSEFREDKLIGCTGKPLKTLVNIGIGGSDLGIETAVLALNEYCDPDKDFYFLSNVDPAAVESIFDRIDPTETLFVVCSKTFTTQETLTNAEACMKKLREAAPGITDYSSHFAAVSSAVDKAEEFGVSVDKIVPMWDWVGGRYSISSGVGLSLMCAVGEENFLEMLRGMELADNHFYEAPLDKNIPVLMALLGIWYVNFLNTSSQAVIPYSQSLCRFAAFLQQLEMESNGKSTRSDGSRVDYCTSPVIWGEAGTNSQHSFFQMIHQGTFVIPIDFIGFSKPPRKAPQSQHDILMSHFFAQQNALAFGKTAEELKGENTPSELVPHKMMPGNRPSTCFLFDELSPRNLGMLISFYEQKVFTQGVIWDILSFDQWGVELGKNLAKDMLVGIKNGKFEQGTDSSTERLVTQYLKWVNLRRT